LRVGQRALQQGFQPRIQPAQIPQAAVNNILQRAAFSGRFQHLQALGQNLMQSCACQNVFERAGGKLLQITHRGL